MKGNGFRFLSTEEHRDNDSVMSSKEDNFQIFIALPTDDVCTVKGLSREMFVYELKSRVELKAGIPGDIFHLFFMNSQLLDKETLRSYNLKQGCIVRVKIETNWIIVREDFGSISGICNFRRHPLGSWGSESSEVDGR